MIDDRLPVPGASLDREIAHGEAVDAEIERFIERRGANPPRGEEEARFEDSELRHNAQREARIRFAKVQYHYAHAARLRATVEALAQSHVEAAERLQQQMKEEGRSA